MSAVLFRDVRVVTADGVRDTRVLVEDERIAEIGDELDLPEGADLVSGVSGDTWLLPGWIDVQVNDIAWLARGEQEPESHADRIREVLRYQAQRGVTGIILATLAAPLAEVESYLRGMKGVLDGDPLSLDGVLLGGLVEGTFMNPEFHGAHNPRWVLPPDRDVLDRLLATGAVRMLNVAPETADNALELIEAATRRGVVVGCGHAKPHAERLRAAVAAGLRYIIHLGNGPTGSSWKSFHDGGMLEESLRNDDLTATIIVDGHHVHPQLVRDWIDRKEVSRVVGISDAGFATGAPEGGFEVFGIRGQTSEDGSYLRVVRDADTERAARHTSDAAALFGAAIGMREVFENLVNLLSTEMEGVYRRRHEAMPLDAAIVAASRMCAANPAGLLELDDRGTIHSGKRADLVLLRVSAEGATGVEADVLSTWVAGHQVEP